MILEVSQGSVSVPGLCALIKSVHLSFQDEHFSFEQFLNWGTKLPSAPSSILYICRLFLLDLDYRSFNSLTSASVLSVFAGVHCLHLHSMFPPPFRWRLLQVLVLYCVFAINFWFSSHLNSGSSSNPAWIPIWKPIHRKSLIIFEKLGHCTRLCIYIGANLSLFYFLK